MQRTISCKWVQDIGLLGGTARYSAAVSQPEVCLMIRIFALALTSSLAAWAIGCVEGTGEPSVGAKGIPGAMGTIEFKPNDWIEGETSWWIDSDGVAPGVAGCHIGTDESGAPNGRMFGEACLPNGRLVESNPGADELHSHADDTGHPDTFDCAEWCVGQGGSSGACFPAPAPPCARSAICSCNP